MDLSEKSGLDINTAMVMGGAFVPLVWMMGLSNYYTGSKRGRPLGFMLSFILGLLTFIGAMTAVIPLMAICKYDLNDAKNQSSMPIYVLALFLLCMDLWLDRPSKGRGDPTSLNLQPKSESFTTTGVDMFNTCKTMAEVVEGRTPGGRDVIEKAENTDKVTRVNVLTKMPEEDKVSKGDICAYLTLCLAAILSISLMRQPRSLLPTFTDMRNILGFALAVPILLMMGRKDAKSVTNEGQGKTQLLESP